MIAVRRRGPLLPARRFLLLAPAAAALALAAVGMQSTAPPEPPAASPLAQQLEPRTWALALPTAWLAAPIPGLRGGDVLDLIGARGGELAQTIEVASGLRVVSAEGSLLIVELTDADATAIATARAGGLAIIPILRSDR